jgi:hypothetical protein
VPRGPSPGRLETVSSSTRSWSSTGWPVRWEARQLGGAVKLAISHFVGDPWQVRARAQEAISHKLNEFAAQGDSVVTPAGEFPKDVVMERLGALRSSVGYDVSFHEFALALVTNLDPSVLPDSTDPYRIRVCKWLCWCCDS